MHYLFAAAFDNRPVELVFRILLIIVVVLSAFFALLIITMAVTGGPAFV